MMNIFRLLGDLSHVLAIALLLAKIWKTRSAAGISGKSQLLFAIVYMSRYLDIFTTFISAYNTVMKLMFITASCTTVYLIYFHFRATYDGNHDTFSIYYLLTPSALLALKFNDAYDGAENYQYMIEILWAFSIYLEAVAIFPQLFMVSKTGEAENITAHYLFMLGSYRGFYILNWIYRYHTEGHFEIIAITAGIVQTVLYVDFFYIYVTKVLHGKKLQLLP
jgi:ER lumen protein retaining receptor